MTPQNPIFSFKLQDPNEGATAVYEVTIRRTMSSSTGQQISVRFVSGASCDSGLQETMRQSVEAYMRDCLQMQRCRIEREIRAKVRTEIQEEGVRAKRDRLAALTILRNSIVGLWVVGLDESGGLVKSHLSNLLSDDDGALSTLCDKDFNAAEMASNASMLRESDGKPVGCTECSDWLSGQQALIEQTAAEYAALKRELGE